jgi:rubrerythrin
MSKADRNFVSANELLEIAVEFEVDSVEYYRMMKKTQSNVHVLDLLGLLEEQEKDHVKMLREFDLGPGPYEVVQYAPSFRLSMPSLKSDNPEFDELLDLAIEREVKSVEIYEKSSAVVTGKLKDLLDDLAGFEREHEYKLKDLRSFLHGEDKV